MSASRAGAALPCSGAPPIACGAVVAGATLPGGTQADSYGCSALTYTGGEAVYALTVSSLQSVTVSLSGMGGRDLDVFLLRTGCDPAVDCIAGGADVVNGPVMGAGTYLVVVDAKTPLDEGGFTLSVSCTPAATPIACNSTVGGAVAGVSRVLSYGCLPGTYPGSESLYELTLAAPATVLATLSPAAPLDIALLDDAALPALGGPAACRRGADAQVAALNLPAGKYVLALDDPIGIGASYSLQVTCSPALSAAPIACGDVNVLGDTSGPSYAEQYGCRTGTFPTGEAYYHFLPTSRVIAAATARDPAFYDVFAFHAPDVPTSCMGGGATVVTVWNARPGDDLVFSLDGTGAAVGQTALSLSCTPMAPTPLTCGTSVPGLTPNAAGALNNYSCTPIARGGPEAVFSFTNPTTQTIAFALDNVPPGANLSIFAFDGPFLPTAPVCVSGGGIVASIPSAPPGDYLVVVDGPTAARNVAFDIVTVCGGSLDCSAAPPLSCNAVVSGDTTGGPSTSTLYTSGPIAVVYTGPERVYHFSNPVQQSVNFLLRNASNPDLDLLLVSSCDPAALIDWDDDSLIEPQLPAGEYDLIVDGKNGASGSFEIVTFCGGPALDPPVLSTVLSPGQCLTETKLLFFPTTVPEADVMFSFDLSGSMREELDQVKQNAQAIYTALNTLVPSLRFGLASLVEYPFPYTDTVCGVNHIPSTPTTPWPYKLHQPLTTDINLVDTVLQTIQIQGGAEETYTRSFYESYTDPNIGWRSCSKRLWLNFADEVPIDCNTYACIGLTRNTGRDCGPDMVTGTPDDIEIIPTVDAMAANGIILDHIDSSENATQIAMWDCLAQRTGGQAFVTDRNGNIPGGVDIVRGLVGVIKQGFRTCPLVQLVATGPYASWVTISPVSVSNVTTPWLGTFSIQICVPLGIPPGSYPISIQAVCAGASLCAPFALGTQSISIQVPNVCGVDPVAVATAPSLVCRGSTVTLDGSTSVACGPSGLQYRWLEGANVVCDWSTNPTCDVVPNAATSYRLEVACVGLPASCSGAASVSVDVVAPAAVAGPDVLACAADTVVLDASGSSAPGCPVPLIYEWRRGAVVVQPAGPLPTYTPPTGLPGTTTYTVVVACPAVPGCQASDDVSVSIAAPAAVAGPDRTACVADPIVLDASGSSAPGCPVPLVYEWRQGAVVVRPAGPSPTYTPPTGAPGTISYTAIVSCPAVPGCQATDDVSVTVSICALAVRFDWYEAVAGRAGTPGVEVRWKTIEESGTNVFLVERAAAANGPFTQVGEFVDARGAGTTYVLRDPEPLGAGARFYRIVELTDDGTGDTTSVFAARPAATTGTLGGGSRGRQRTPLPPRR